jgi:hypothetical protein
LPRGSDIEETQQNFIAQQKEEQVEENKNKYRRQQNQETPRIEDETDPEFQSVKIGLDVL